MVLWFFKTSISEPFAISSLKNTKVGNSVCHSLWWSSAISSALTSDPFSQCYQMPWPPALQSESHWAVTFLACHQPASFCTGTIHSSVCSLPFVEEVSFLHTCSRYHSLNCGPTDRAGSVWQAVMPRVYDTCPWTLKLKVLSPINPQMLMYLDTTNFWWPPLTG